MVHRSYDPCLTAAQDKFSDLFLFSHNLKFYNKKFLCLLELFTHKGLKKYTGCYKNVDIKKMHMNSHQYCKNMLFILCFGLEEMGVMATKIQMGEFFIFFCSAWLSSILLAVVVKTHELQKQHSSSKWYSPQGISTKQRLFSGGIPQYIETIWCSVWMLFFL